MTADQLVIRKPAVAGLFYPADPSELALALDRAFAEAHPAPAQVRPRALIVPHAGYVYSGAIAASGYRLLAPLRAAITRVVLLGPSHRVYVTGMAVSGADAFATPWGLVRLDRAACDELTRRRGVRMDDEPHAREHSLEVHLPFLQHVLGDFRLIPLAVGHSRPPDIAELIEWLWADDTTLIVVSTDLSHYDPYEVAQRRDRRTADAIVATDAAAIGDLDACGAHPLRGLLVAAAHAGLTVTEIDVRNSGDTAGDPNRVVGYGSFVLT